MPYTVVNADGGNTQREFDIYLRLLHERGVEWAETQRIEEPGTEHRWVYVWDNRSAAEAFCGQLNSEAGSGAWYVREVDPATPISRGPLMPVIINRTRRGNGFAFQLHPHSRAAIRRRFPHAHQMSNLSIEYSNLADFEESHGPVYDHVASVLTGLSEDELTALGGFEIHDAGSDRRLFNSPHQIVG